MTVYVDDMYRYPMGALGWMKMSHMIADSTEELVQMAMIIGVNPKWIQCAGTNREHFDISLGKRKLAVENGAVEITIREMARMTR